MFSTYIYTVLVCASVRGGKREAFSACFLLATIVVNSVQILGFVFLKCEHYMYLINARPQINAGSMRQSFK